MIQYILTMALNNTYVIRAYDVTSNITTKIDCDVIGQHSFDYSVGAHPKIYTTQQLKRAFNSTAPAPSQGRAEKLDR